jgi:pimeloyl-ACP methyl ester carboxylesterase
MKRLGYTKYVAQGGDWGAIVTDLMGAQEPEGLIGIHTNMPKVIPAAIDASLIAGNPLPAGLSLSDEEKAAVEQLDFVYRHVYYAYMMASRPQTLTGLVDSPVGLAAFLLDHDKASLALISRAFAGHTEGLTRDDVLDNITLFWLTNTAISAARLYAENKTSFFGINGVTLPVAVSVFPDELYQAPKSWAEQAYPNLVHYNRLPKGGHFAAWEQPELLVEEIRAGLRSLR